MKSLALMSDIFATLLLIALLHEGEKTSLEDSKEASLESSLSGETTENRIEVTVVGNGSYVISGKLYNSFNALRRSLEQKKATTVALQFNNQATLHQQALKLTAQLSDQFKIKYRWEKTNENQ
ncbi:MAG: hypothetical protein COB83_04005 [Gammaproteobacteria bacterium]|nr:MAG: hypothetical protein COB83_04005 [Gammaproteobacteria bacterium]